MNCSIIVYTGIFIFYRFLTLLTPFYELFARDGWSVLPKLIGLTGGVLLAADLLTERKTLQCAHVKWVLLLLLTLVTSSAVRYQYVNAFEFAKYIVYVSVQDLLILSAGLRMSREEQGKFLKKLHTAISVVFIPAMCYMFWQFLTLQHYYNLDHVHQGWSDGRLYGIMYILYDGALGVSVLAFGTAFLLIRSKRILQKVLYGAELIICIIYIALSDCRTAYAACAAGIGMAVMYHFAEACHAGEKKLFPLIAKWLLVYMAALIIIIVGISWIRGTGFSIVRNIHSVHSVHSTDAESHKGAARKLGRPKQQSFSTGRVEIWKTYIDIMTDKPEHLIFGLSYNGYSQYIREHYPDSFIITYFREHYPESYRKGNVYLVHNSYLFALVTAGIPGLLALLIFLAASAYDVLKHMFCGQMTAFECLLAALIAMLMTAGLFEHNVFITVSAPAGCFWMTAGLLLGKKEVGQDENA